jgi:DNA repair exonuclease SbcCD ATPase subunit
MSESLKAAAELPAAIVSQGSALLERAKSVVIQSDDDYVSAANFVNDIKATEKRIDEDRVRLKAPFLAGVRQIDDYFRAPLAACAEAVKSIKRTMLAYDERKRREREEAERQAAAERRRLEEEAQAKARAEEQARQAAERARLAEETRRREAAEAEARRAREAEEAANAKARGDQEAAEAAERRAKQAEEDAAKAREQSRIDREAAIAAKRQQLAAERAHAQAQEEAAKPIAVTPEPPKVAGVARKRVWKYRIVKRLAVPDSYLIPDEAKIQAAVDRLKDMAQEALGDWIEVYSEEALAVGKVRKPL